MANDLSSKPRLAMTPVDLQAPRKDRLNARWVLLVALVSMTGLGLVLLFLLTLATRNRALYEQNFVWLVSLNASGGASLAAACCSSWRPSSAWSGCCPAC